MQNDHEDWLSLWRRRDTQFHQRAVNPLLTRFWSGLALPRRSRVLVPLCGKSLDMIWLAAQGHEVIGVELSPVAVKAFFSENHLKPVRKKAGHLTLWKNGRLSIYCGDLFQLRPEQLGPIDAIYDRAALTALPPALRGAYVEQLQYLSNSGAPILLLTTEDREKTDSYQAFHGIDAELTTLCIDHYDIILKHAQNEQAATYSSPRHPAALSKVYELTPRT